MSVTVNPLHRTTHTLTRKFLPGRLGLVLEQREDGRYYLDEFLSPTSAVTQAQLKIGDILTSVNGIPLRHLEPSQMKRLFDQPETRETVWSRVGKIA